MTTFRMLVTTAGLVTALAAGCATPQAPAHSSPASDVRVGLREYEVLVSHAAVSPGEVVLNVTNTGAEAHDLRVEGTETLAASPVIPPGGTAMLKISVRDDQAQVLLWCTVPGHRSQGMVTHLVIATGEAR
jgi:hypothetical protein